MNKHMIVAALLGLAAATSFAEGIGFSTAETGFSNIDYSAKEQANTATTSTLNIPNFKARTAEGSRWMMCVYTNIAMMRHKKYWTATYPSGNEDTVKIGFPESESKEDLDKLRADFSGDHTLKTMPTEKMLYFCVHEGYKFKYVPVGQ